MSVAYCVFLDKGDPLKTVHGFNRHTLKLVHNRSVLKPQFLYALPTLPVFCSTQNQRNLFSLFKNLRLNHRHFPNIVRLRSENRIIFCLLKDMCRPADNSACCKSRGEKIRFHLNRFHNGCSIKFNIGV